MTPQISYILYYVISKRLAELKQRAPFGTVPQSRKDNYHANWEKLSSAETKSGKLIAGLRKESGNSGEKQIKKIALAHKPQPTP